jgi:hypothetical protein
MDFVERLFGMSPDAGNGIVELLVFAALALLFLAIGARRHRWPILRR